MKNFKIYFLSIIAAFSIFAANAQTVDEVINKHIDAIGGKDLVGKVNSVYIEATMSVMGNDAPNAITIVNGKGYKSETDFNGQKIINCITDKGGWMVNPMAGANDPTAMTADQVKGFKEQLYFDPLYNYAANGYKA